MKYTKTQQKNIIGMLVKLLKIHGCTILSKSSTYLKYAEATGHSYAVYTELYYYEVDLENDIVDSYCYAISENNYINNWRTISLHPITDNAIEYYKVHTINNDSHRHFSTFLDYLKSFYNNFCNDDEEITNKLRAYVENIYEIKELKDFIYRIDESNNLKVCLDYSIDNFFDANDESLEIIAIDSNEIIVTIDKEDDKYMFVVDLTSTTGDNYSVHTAIKSAQHLNKLISSTVDALRSYDDFNKYADYLEELIN